MANKRIKRVIIAGAGFSAPAKLPIQSRIIDRMAEVPEMDFLTGKMPEESMTFLDAFITVGLFLLDNYAKKDYTEYRVKYQNWWIKIWHIEHSLLHKKLTSNHCGQKKHPKH